MKYQFIESEERLPEVLNVHKTVGGYLKVESSTLGLFAIVTTDNKELAYHESFQKRIRPLIPFREQRDDFSAYLHEMKADLGDLNNAQKRGKIEIDITDYLDTPISGKSAIPINAIQTVIKVGGVEIYREMLPAQEYVSDKSILRQLEEFINELEFAKTLRDHPGEQRVLSKE